jgi:nucleoside-diphosphate-sugar epimerase
MKKILILGSRGQIGLHLTNYFKKKNYKIFTFDISNSLSEDLRKPKNKKLLILIKKIDFIYFLAFDVGGSRYLKKYQNTYNFISNNVKIMCNTFELIKKYKKKFIFASSQMSNMFFSNYGVLKKIGENYTNSLGGVNVRFWNVYGIENDLKKSHVITDFVISALKKNKINILTTGKEKRDFLYVEDCCTGLEIIMKRYKLIAKLKKPIDLAAAKYVPIINIAKIIKKNLNKKNIKITYACSRNLDLVQKSKLNSPNKFFFKLWQPKFTLDKGINEIIKYYIDKYKSA